MILQALLINLRTQGNTSSLEEIIEKIKGQYR